MQDGFIETGWKTGTAVIAPTGEIVPFAATATRESDGLAATHDQVIRRPYAREETQNVRLEARVDRGA